MVIHSPPGVISVPKMSQKHKFRPWIGHISLPRCTEHGTGQQNKAILSSFLHIVSLQPLPDTVECHSSTSSSGHLCVKNVPKAQIQDSGHGLATFQWKAHRAWARPAKQGHHILVPSHSEPPTTSRHCVEGHSSTSRGHLCVKNEPKAQIQAMDWQLFNGKVP